MVADLAMDKAEELKELQRSRSSSGVVLKVLPQLERLAPEMANTEIGLYAGNLMLAGGEKGIRVVGFEQNKLSWLARGANALKGLAHSAGADVVKTEGDMTFVLSLPKNITREYMVASHDFGRRGATTTEMDSTKIELQEFFRSLFQNGKHPDLVQGFGERPFQLGKSGYSVQIKCRAGTKTADMFSAMQLNQQASWGVSDIAQAIQEFSWKGAKVAFAVAPIETTCAAVVVAWKVAIVLAAGVGLIASQGQAGFDVIRDLANTQDSDVQRLERAANRLAEHKEVAGTEPATKALEAATSALHRIADLAGKSDPETHLTPKDLRDFRAAFKDLQTQLPDVFKVYAPNIAEAIRALEKNLSEESELKPQLGGLAEAVAPSGKTANASDTPQSPEAAAKTGGFAANAAVRSTENGWSGQVKSRPTDNLLAQG